jgi:hypothetical protein
MPVGASIRLCIVVDFEVRNVCSFSEVLVFSEKVSHFLLTFLRMHVIIVTPREETPMMSHNYCWKIQTPLPATLATGRCPARYLTRTQISNLSTISVSEAHKRQSLANGPI